MIFGSQEPKFIVGITEIILNHAEMQPDFLKPILLEYASPLDGVRNFIYLGDYAQFRIQVNLFEAIGVTFSQLKVLEKNLCVFFPHKDGDAIKDKFGNNALFLISDVKPFYLNNENKFDMVEITFRCIGFIDYTGIYNILGFGYQFGYNFGYGV